MTEFRDLPDYILAPLQGRAEDAWHAAPAGKWSPAEIVDHLATAMENSAKGFSSRADKPPMSRRPLVLQQRVARVLVLGMGWFPGRRVAPETTRPQSRPERALTETKLRRAVDTFLELERTLLPARATNLFLKHPALGDLTFAEFMRFHVRHAEHHRRQMLERLGG